MFANRNVTESRISLNNKRKNKFCIFSRFTADDVCFYIASQRQQVVNVNRWLLKLKELLMYFLLIH